MHWKTWVVTVWELVRHWEQWKETIFQRLFTYHLPPTSALLECKDLSGISVIVTGSTTGIGLHTAKEFAMAGAHVVMACMEVTDANKIADGWRKESADGRIIKVEVIELNLLSFESVRRFVDAWEQLGKPLDVLINNAGILRVEDAQKFTSKGIEEHMHVNHIAPALLTILLLPSLLKASSARIIYVSSSGHLSGVVEPHYWNNKDKNFNSMKAYGSSKLVHMMFLKVLANKFLCHGKVSIPCIAVHPGAVRTQLCSMMSIRSFLTFEASEGARSVIFCATSDSVKEELVEGFAYYSCTCKPGKISQKAQDMDACSEVWNKTLSILEIKDSSLSAVLKTT